MNSENSKGPNIIFDSNTMISGNATLESIHEIKLNKVRINNCMVLWRLGAYLDILELPLLD